MKLLKRLRANVRMHLGCCPKCNSDAPALDTCKICNSYSAASGHSWPPEDDLKKIWKRRYELDLTQGELL